MTIFDVTTATVQNNQNTAMFMYQRKPMGIELSCANFVLLQVICLAGDHVSENYLYLVGACAPLLHFSRSYVSSEIA